MKPVASKLIFAVAGLLLLSRLYPGMEANSGGNTTKHQAVVDVIAIGGGVTVTHNFPIQ